MFFLEIIDFKKLQLYNHYTFNRFDFQVTHLSLLLYEFIFVKN